VVAWPRLSAQLRRRTTDDGRRGLSVVGGDLIIRQKDRWSYARLVLVAVLAGISLYNIALWVERYALSRDDSYAQVEGYLARTLPPGVGVVARDLLDLYLLPKNEVYTYGYLDLIGWAVDPTNILDRRIPYAILNDQSLFEGYGGANDTYYGWVRRNGEQVQRFDGRLWSTYVYRIDYELATVETIGLDSIAVGKPAFASSAELGGLRGGQFLAEYAFDALATTRWASNESDNQWIYVDLGERSNIERIELSWEAAYAESYQLQVSDDASNWTTFFSNDDGAGGLDVVYASAQGRYIRLLMTERATEFGYSLWEIAVYPTTAATSATQPITLQTQGIKPPTSTPYPTSTMYPTSTPYPTIARP
jgi:F5/8 type C domain-containing protein